MRTLTIIKIVEENYCPSSEELEDIMRKYGDPDKVDEIQDEVLAHNIMEEDLKLTHERLELAPTQLILFKVKTSKYDGRSPESVSKFLDEVTLAVAGAIDGKQEHPFLVMNDDIDVEVISLTDCTVVE